jgi:hypothetical protein
MKRSLATLVLVFMGLVTASAALAAWSTNGNPVCSATGAQGRPVILEDGSGGAYVAWVDSRVGTFQGDIYLQRMSGAGVPQFVADGVAVCAAANDQLSVRMARDGGEGVLLAWEDRRDGLDVEIYAQRVGTDGIPYWTADGVDVPQIAGAQTGPAIISDGQNGAIVAWEDSRNGACRSKDVYVRRVDSRGTLTWTANGVAVCSALDDQDGVQMVGDGSGGAFLAWSDKRSEVRDSYAQRVTSAGAVSWMSNGVALCLAPDRQADLALVARVGGGTVAAWNDWRSGTFTVYAQAVNAAGVPQWTTDGIACAGLSSSSPPVMVGDGNGYLLALNLGNDIYVQRLDAAGVPQWGTNGVALCTATGNQTRPAIVSDGLGGAVVAWTDYRNGNGDIYAQRVNSSGTPQWAADGVALCTAAGDQDRPAIAGDAVAGAIVTWEDPRSGVLDVYAQRVSSAGQVGPTTSVEPGAAMSFALAPARPNPSRGVVELSLTLPASAPTRVELFDPAGRMVRTLASGTLPAGVTTIRWDGCDDSGHPVPSGVYHARAEVGAHTAVARIERVR